ncbi:MAG: hypothetical protein ABIP94_21725 [Planctomycetota bacterium]
MDRLIKFVFDNPILLFILLAWVGGAVGNVLKASKKARDAGSRTPPTSSPARRAPAQPGQRSAEDIAAEMRRILGLEPEAPPKATRTPSAPRTTGQSGPQRRAPLSKPMARTAAKEGPPLLPSQVTASPSERRLDLHGDSHVGQGIQHRHLSKPRAGLRETQNQLGGLGGRTSEHQSKRSVGTRFPLTDLKRIIVLNEILGPPLALRRDDRMV